MESNITDDTLQDVRVIETDQAAVTAEVRRLELYTCVISAIFLAVTIYAFCIYAPLSRSHLFYKVVAVLIGISLIILGILHFVGPLFLRKMDVYIGSDFIAGPEYGSLFLMRLLGRKFVLRYNDIVGVNLDISKGRITGATVGGKDLVTILVRRVREPHIVIRAIREHTGQEVRWHRSPPRLTKLNGDEVDSLIKEGEKKNFEEREKNRI
jgi:hypothetical protein